LKEDLEAEKKNNKDSLNKPPSSRDLHKMEKSICYAQIHGEKMLKEIAEKFIRDCTSESPNAFWHREKYFVSLPYDPLVKINPQKASTTLMSPTEIQTFQQEINDLLQKGLIESSKSAWACRGFYVNKHSETEKRKAKVSGKFQTTKQSSPAYQVSSSK
jgi:regulator of sigma D